LFACSSKKMHSLRKALADVDGASVLSSRTTRSRVTRGATRNHVPIKEEEKGAFTHACSSRGLIHECAAEAVAMFLQAFATQIGAPAKRVYFSFVLATIRRMETFRGTAEGAASLYLGDMARSFMAFPLLAYTVMSNAPIHTNPMIRVLELCDLLSEKLPSQAAVETWEGTEMKLATTRMNARCAIPFAFGMNRLIPNSRLDFVIKSIVNGELKSVRYFLSYVLPTETEQFKAHADSSSESSSDSSSESSSDSDHEDGGAAGAGASAAAGDHEAAAAGDHEAGGAAGAGASSAAGDHEAGGAAGAGASLRRVANLPPIHMRPFLSSREFKAIIERIPPYLIFEFLHSFGMHNPPYRFVPDPEARDVIMKEQAYIPPCRGSVLRAYCRSVLDVNVDNEEPDIQTFSDCIVGI
jgi:hypothetical protein